MTRVNFVVNTTEVLLYIQSSRGRFKQGAFLVQLMMLEKNIWVELGCIGLVAEAKQSRDSQEK